MPQEILDQIGEAIDTVLSDPTVQLAFRLVVIYVGLIWLATAYWAYKDLRMRTANPILPYLAAAAIILFTPFLFVFAALLYKLVRPGETVAEANERALAEEAMLVEIEKQQHCGACRHPIERDWIICPYCRTKLRRVCPTCGHLVEMEWSLCAHCGKDFERPEPVREAVRAPLPRPAPAIPTAAPAFGSLASTPTEPLRGLRPQPAQRVQAVPRPRGSAESAHPIAPTSEPLPGELPPTPRAARGS